MANDDVDFIIMQHNLMQTMVLNNLPLDNEVRRFMMPEDTFNGKLNMKSNLVYFMVGQ